MNVRLLKFELFLLGSSSRPSLLVSDLLQQLVGCTASQHPKMTERDQACSKIPSESSDVMRERCLGWKILSESRHQKNTLVLLFLSIHSRSFNECITHFFHTTTFVSGRRDFRLENGISFLFIPHFILSLLKWRSSFMTCSTWLRVWNIDQLTFYSGRWRALLQVVLHAVRAR